MEEYQINKSKNKIIGLTRHPKCLGYQTEDHGWGSDFECGYNTKIDCDECKYGGGRKDPRAKKNWI